MECKGYGAGGLKDWSHVEGVAYGLGLCITLCIEHYTSDSGFSRELGVKKGFASDELSI